MTVKQNGYNFLIRDRYGKISVRVSCKRPPFEHEISSGCPTVEAAAGKAELNRCLNEALKLHAAAQAHANQGAAQQPPIAPPPAGSFLAVLLSMFARLGAHRWAQSTREGFGFMVEYIRLHLELGILHRPIDRVLYKEYHVVAVALNQDPDITDSKYQAKQMFRRTTDELVKRGLPRECLDAVDLIEAKSPHKKRGQPNSDEDILRMLDVLETQSFPVQFLFWTGFSGGPQAGDAGSIMLTEQNRVTGKVRLDRMKTGGIAEYALMAKGLKCVNAHEFGKYDVFVLQELLKPGPPFSIDEIKDVKALINRWTSPSDPVSDFLSGELSHSDRMALVTYNLDFDKSEKRARCVLTKILNRALKKNELLQQQFRRGMKLRQETVERVGQQPPEPNPAGVIRMVLEDAYPTELMCYPNEVTFSQFAEKAGKVWREFLRSLGISDKSFKSFRQLVTTDSLSRGVRDALVARVQGNGLNAVTKYDFPEDWQFFLVRDLREQLLQGIRSGNCYNFVLTYEDLVHKLQDFIQSYIQIAEELATRRHKDLTNKIEAASAATSNAVQQVISSHDESDSRAHASLMEKADLVLRRIEILEKNLQALADQIFGAEDPYAPLLSALRHHLGRDLTSDEISAVERGQFPASLQLGNLPEAA